MGIRSSMNKLREYQTLISQFQLLQQNESRSLKYLQHKLTRQEYLLRQLTFYQEQSFIKKYNYFNKFKQIFQNNHHILNIKKIIINKEEGIIINVYTIYLLLEYPQRTLDDQINQRGLQRKNFQEDQLWSILASCILGLNHLYKNGIQHKSLKSSSILIDQDGGIKLYDPEMIGAKSNYNLLIEQRNTPHLYLSPEQIEDLKKQIVKDNNQSSKDNIWTLGMIIIEAGLLMYQDHCYRNNYTQFDWMNLKKSFTNFQAIYSTNLCNILRFMLNKDYRSRPNWQQLQDHISKIEQDHEQLQIEDKVSNKISSEVVDCQTPSPKNRILYNGSFNNKHTKTHSLILQESISHPPQLITWQSNNSKILGTKRSSSRIHDSDSQLIKKFIAISQISKTRPLKSIFPVNQYQTLTNKDENYNQNHQKSFQQSQIILQEIPLNLSQNQQDQPSFHELQNNKQSNNFHNLQQKSDQIQKYFRGQPIYNSFYFNKNQNNQSKQSKKFHNDYFIPNNDRINQYKNNVIQFVVQNYQQGSKYQGYMLNRLKHGYGKFYYQDGGYYDGNWFLGKMHGKGKLYYQSGKLAYDGEWKQDKFYGFGRLYNENPSNLNHSFDFRNFDYILQFWTKYEGYFIDDFKCGQGTIYLSNGQFYSGNFSNDLIDGEGIFETLDGRRIKGHWQKNHIL